MKNFWKVVNEVIKESDILLIVLDARVIDETRNKEIEDKVEKANKKLIYVINKSDLVPRSYLEKQKRRFKRAIFISSLKKQGTTILLHKIMETGQKDEIVVGVLGYPNVGKSSVINALKGKASASTSSQSGHTKGKQLLRINNRVSILDTPGVLPYMEKDEIKHALTASIDPSKIKDPEDVVRYILQAHKGLLEQYFKVEPHKDPAKVLERIALKKNVLIKGGGPDIDRMARTILRLWQKGKIK
ncbi:MAG: GTPase [archaeon]